MAQSTNENIINWQEVGEETITKSRSGCPPPFMGREERTAPQVKILHLFLSLDMPLKR